MFRCFLDYYDRLGTGAAGPAFFGLGLKQSLLILLVVDLMYALSGFQLFMSLIYLRKTQLLRVSGIFVSHI